MIALLLVGFVLVATGVIARRVAGVRQQREITELQRKREALVADRVKLEGAIREASSRAKLQPIAEQRLNMRIPRPDQQVFLNRQPKPAAPRTPNDSL
jgi:cell division protein FtsL